MRDVKCSLLFKPDSHGFYYQHISPEMADWDFLSFKAVLLRKGETLDGNTGDEEMLFVLLGGNFTAKTSAGKWKTVKGRKNVFSGLPHALYLPPNTKFEIIADSIHLDLAVGSCKAEHAYPAQLITPDDVLGMGIELRGGDNASRQINRILPPGSKCHRLVCVEVYTPSGNWSSFPAHKHDTVKIDPQTGDLHEAKLEEVYFYKIDKAQGFAIQKIYTDDRSLDEIAEARNNDAVIVPRGYHPVMAGHGYNVYYLNFLAGSHQSLANSNDPDHQWIYGTWKEMDQRLPMVTLKMNYSNPK